MRALTNVNRMLSAFSSLNLPTMLSAIIRPLFFFSALTSAAPTATSLEKRATVQGFDISHYQSNVDFQGAYNAGARFVIIKVPLLLSPPQLFAQTPQFF